MDYDDELGASVWDDQNNDSNVRDGGELATTFATLSAGKGDQLEHSEWNDDAGIKPQAEPIESEGDKKDLMLSLAPEEDPLTGLSVPEPMVTSEKGETLFGDVNTSPLEVSENDSQKSTTTEEVSPLRKPYAKPQKLFSSARLRRHPLTEVQKADLFEDPLASNSADIKEDEFVEESLEYDGAPEESKDILQQMEAPLFKISPRKNLSSTPSIKKVVQNAGANSQFDVASMEAVEINTPCSNYTIEVVDPLKVGDLTFAHVEYTICSKSEKLNPPEVRVQRRYRDFRWLYRQLQNNHWGKIIPPPPEKQAVGRFKDDFIESRKLQMERMLNKIAQDKDLQDDADFMMFLQSQNFGQDSKVREHLTGSNASSDSNDISEIHISAIELLGQEDAVNVMKNGGLDESQKGFMNISFASLPKYTESDTFFVEQKQAIDILEEQLKQLCKSLEIVDTQRNDLASVTEEFANTIKSLEELEVSKKGSEILVNFADVHLRIKESLQRSTMQEALTLGVTIDEYMRSLGSIRAVFNQRSKLGYYAVVVEHDLLKKRTQLERNNHKGPSDKVEALNKDSRVLEDRHYKIKTKWQEIGATIRKELRRNDFDKMVDFRNSIEIFLESSIETQKECIELWETFYQNNL
ncbi:LANO_0H23882g1_1 [Lachancea nothofagi CBS 11611]|uniref:LANO_0H23882g1_1 n=1 Tax=Lachancea nothofagi CBS 11611 TaxID=1266666 RepID=A0A1G4KNV4_9SACH|nr:LANO_0H23882g1_1 [Lachancea nothofagi CBS 11611]